jgi:hypothetical protein
MLLVLFVVVLVRSHGQVLLVRQLQRRIELLETSRSEERAANQDSQLRAIGKRLQELETREGQWQEQLEAERSRLEQALTGLGRGRGLPEVEREAALEEEPLPPPPRPRGDGGPPLRPVGAAAGPANQER